MAIDQARLFYLIEAGENILRCWEALRERVRDEYRDMQRNAIPNADAYAAAMESAIRETAPHYQWAADIKAERVWYNKTAGRNARMKEYMRRRRKRYGAEPQPGIQIARPPRPRKRDRNALGKVTIEADPNAMKIDQGEALFDAPSPKPEEPTPDDMDNLTPEEEAEMRKFGIPPHLIKD